jgi:hypothetical protein
MTDTSHHLRSDTTDVIQFFTGGNLSISVGEKLSDDTVMVTNCSSV